MKMKSCARLFLAVIIALLVTAVYPVGAKSISLEGGNSAVIKGPDGVEAVSTQDGQKVIAIGSIQAAVDAAEEGAKIFLKHKTYYENVYIPKSLDIIGKGSDKTIVDGRKGTGSVFTIMNSPANPIPGGPIVTLSGLTIRGGSGTLTPLYNTYCGGGIWNEGKLTVEDCLISENTLPINEFSLGGGIYNDQSGTAKVIDCIISHNNGYGAGGGISNLGMLDVKNSVISNNDAGYYGEVKGGGGGIWNSGPAIVEGSTISDNTAGYLGGGIETSNQLTLIDCTISGNKVSGIDVVGGGKGGGIHTYGGTTTLDNCIIKDNTAQYGGGISNGDSRDWLTSILTITNSCITENTASAAGGGIYWINYEPTITNSLVTANTPDDIAHA
jgi:hypothetical protein